jgi:polysaccharide biosynthesis protein PslJ
MHRPPSLPVWPLHLMFSLMPLWWVAGGFYLLWAALSLVLLIVLLVHGRLAAPPGLTIWLLFVAIVAVSATRVEKLTAVFMFGLKFSFMIAALIVYLYVYNAAREGVAWQRLFRPLCLFWLGMVVLGWISVLAPQFSITTPVEMLLPDSIAADRGLRALVHSHMTEFNPQSRNPYFRTAAPYAYTNNWGTAFAILVPCMVAYVTSVRTGRLRLAVLVSLPVALVPAFLTLNRGMFIGLGAGLVYLGLRALVRGDGRLIASIAGVALIGWIVTLFVPVTELITNRVQNTSSTSDRLDLYLQTVTEVLKSPLLGYGAPRFADTTAAAEPLGTQGQLWLTMFSHGIPALLLFLTFLVVVAWRLSAAVSAPGRWLSAVPVIALVITPFYGYTDPNMSVMFFAFGLAAAAIDGPVNRPAVSAARRA